MLIRIIALACLVPISIAAAHATESVEKSQAGWPAFRGPQSTGVALDATPPVVWSESKNVRWKVELPGTGHATPVIWGDRIFVLAALSTGSPPVADTAPAAGAGRMTLDAPTALHRFVVLALDRATGKQLWQTTVREEVPHEGGHPSASQASASPVTDGRHLWASFGSRGLYCLDFDGKIVWQRDLGKMKTRNEFGEGSSPVLHGDTLIVNWDHEGDSFLVALDKRTGKERFRIARDEPTTWATPLVIRDGERDLVVVNGTNRVRAYALSDGTEVWQCGGLGVNPIPSPVADAETLFVMTGYREAAGFAIRYPGATGDLTGSDRVRWRIERGVSYVPSPLLQDGKLYFVKRFSGVLACHDLKTGEAYYEEQRLEGVDNVYASPVGAAGRVYVVGREGGAAVFRSGPKFEQLAQNKLDDSFDASPAIAGDTIYLRGHRYLYAIASAD